MLNTRMCAVDVERTVVLFVIVKRSVCAEVSGVAAGNPECTVVHEALKCRVRCDQGVEIGGA